MYQERIIYRVAVAGMHCRSSVELVRLKLSALDGVEAASVSSDHVLTVFAVAEAVSPDDIVRVLIDAGVTPVDDVSVAPTATPEPVSGFDIQTEVVEEPVPVEQVEEIAAPVSPRAALMQRIKVAVSDDYYPSRIDVIPGVPVEIEFGEGHGCLARVVFEEFGIDADLTDGGAVVRLPGLSAGEYGFSCGMDMIHGRVVAAV